MAVDEAGRWVPAACADPLYAVWLLARREFGNEFPSITIWFGLATRKWWALVPAPGGWWVLDSPHPEDLRMQIRGAMRSWSIFAPSTPGDSVAT
ncbi:hypothetical protein [Thermomonospora cellulosilytica]|uniref:Uncharacterized protein n=1 Tax=Thermomonospora cellulosilytica TaxID=1411118 RepID=A0A7W3MWA0_9ACTN|nr:hypothetical protein [Thermomonospora cellulosilytica]MBA9003078.1 hypothetical protein [Thermomonospora cellulosilytica]